MSQDAEREDLMRLLDEVGRREAEERREAEALEDAPGLRDVERVLEGVWAESQKRRTRRWPLFVGLLAATAAAIALLVPRQETQVKVVGPAGQVLGVSDEVKIQDPSEVQPGQFPEYVTWTGPKGLEYVLRVVEYVDGSEGRELYAPRAIIAMREKLPAEMTRTWPDKIKLLLKARDKEGEEQGSDERIWERSR